MARTEVITDDITGEVGAKPLRFAVERSTYELDVVESTRASFLAALEPFIVRARRTSFTPVSRAAVSSESAIVERRVRQDYLTQVRAWAAKNDVALPQRGRIPGEILARYEAETTAKPARQRRAQ